MSAFVVFASAALTFASFADYGQSLEAVRGTPNIDGEAEAMWELCTSTARVDKPHDGVDPGSSNYAEVKAMWDDECLYFLVTAHDSDFDPEGDVFEFYLDEKYDKSETYNKYDRQTRLSVSGNWLNSVTDEDGNDTGREELYKSSAYKTTGDGWVMEVALKWNDDIRPAEGDVMGLEFMWDDTGIAAWRWNVDTANGETAPYASTENFAPMTLGSAKNIAESTDETDDNAAPQTVDTFAISVTGIVMAAAAGLFIWKKLRDKG